MSDNNNRRAFLVVAGAGALLAACRKEERASAGRSDPSANRSPLEAGAVEPKPDKDDEVSATEDLMREHGVIRRVLVVYREASTRLRAKSVSVAPALQQAAKLMRTFAEDYHEKQLKELHIFPALTKAAGPLTATVNTLIAQHARGREVTEYILAVTHKAIGVGEAQPLARTLDAFARMYEEHAAIEDTIVFPAWKKALTPTELDAMGDRFEDIEHATFGKDGFEAAVSQIEAIERMMGIELATLTAPPPPAP